MCMRLLRCFIQEKSLSKRHMEFWIIERGISQVDACMCACIPLEHSDFLMTTSVAHIHFYAVCGGVRCACVALAGGERGEREIEVVLLKPMPHIKPQFKMQLLILWARHITPDGGGIILYGWIQAHATRSTLYLVVCAIASSTQLPNSTQSISMSTTWIFCTVNLRICKLAHLRDCAKFFHLF